MATFGESSEPHTTPRQPDASGSEPTGPSVPRTSSYTEAMARSDSVNASAPFLAQHGQRGSEATQNFLPPPKDGLVTVLSSAELHELRKDSRALQERYQYLAHILQDAKINEEHVFPTGDRRVVRTVDIVDVGREMVRLLQVQPEPIGLSFQDLSIAVVESGSNTIATTGSTLLGAAKAVASVLHPTPPAHRHIIQNVSGSVSPGEMLLVIGPTGAGCSTLMKVLGGRYSPHDVKVTGDLSYGARNCSQDGRVWKPPPATDAHIGFCYEEDEHIPELTVRESLQFVAEHSWPKAVGPKGSAEQALYREAREVMSEVMVTQTMRNLGIAHVGDTQVGDDLIRGVSGGQKKRVTIGEVTVSRPVLTFYDGYTRGLDSATALGLAQSLAMFCWTSQGGRTVIASQYQASQEIFEIFDKVLVLQKEEDPAAPSQMVYFGPTSPDALEEFFGSVGCVKPKGYTWPDYLGTMVGGRHMTDPQPRDPNGVQSAADLAARFRAHRLGQAVAAAVANQAHRNLNPRIVAAIRERLADSQHPETESKSITDFFDNREQSPEFVASTTKPIVASFGAQLRAAIKREWRLLFARKRETRTLLVRTVLMSVIQGFLFYQIPRTFGRAFERTAVVQMVTLLSAASVFNVVPSLLGDRSVMYRHTRNHLHRGSSFFLAKSAIQLPVQLLQSLLTAAIIPTLAGFQMDGDHWIYFYVCHVALSLAAVNIVKGFIFLGKDLFAGYLMGFFSLVTMMLLNGFMLPASQIGWWFRWFVYLNPLQWAFSGLVMNEFDGEVFTEVPGGGSIGGEELRRQLFKIEYGTEFKWAVVGIQLVLTVVGVLFGCWVCENVRHDEEAHKVKFRPPCPLRGRLSVLHRFLPHSHCEAHSSLDKASDRESRNFSATMLTKTEVSPGKEPAEKEAGAPSEGTSVETATEAGPDVAVAMPLAASASTSQAYFTFSNVSYTVDVPVSDAHPDGKLKLLNNVNGYVKPGMTVALMGTSGAGKTTLLDVIADRKTGGHIEGEILVNGVPRDESFARICGYVEQTDMHMARCTVKEALIFAARLGRTPGESEAAMLAAVDDVITVLELERLQDAMIGSPDLGTGISAEAVKRVTIGVELVTDPAVLLMDEPTSGLDTAGALLVAGVTRNIARSGKAVICTIHQPSRMVLESFDHMLMLQKGGNTVYFGEIGPESRSLVGYFEDRGAPPCPVGANPAEYMLDVVSPSTGQPLCDWSVDQWAPSEENARLVAALASRSAGVVPAGTAPLVFPLGTSASGWVQFRTLLSRQLVAMWRNPSTTIGLMCAALYPAILLGLLFFDRTGNEAENGANYTSTALYAASFITPAFFIFLCLPGVYEDRAAFYRETASKLYSKRLYAVAVQLASIPYLLIASTLNSAVTYNLIPFREGGYGFFWLMFSTFLLLGWWQGIAVGALTPSMAIGTPAVIVPLNLSTLFCGFLVARDNIGWWFRWLYYLNPCGITYVLQGLYKNEFEPRFPFTRTPGVTTGRDFLSQRGWNDDEGEKLTKWECLGILWIFAGMWIALGQWALVHKRHGTR